MCRSLATFAITALLLAGCHKAPEPANRLNAADNALVDASRPGRSAASRALASVIRVDPAQHAMPAVTEGSGCLGGLAYAPGWAAKLPADLPMHPRAKLEEAAGHDGGCKARVVSFAVPGDRQAVLGWYAVKAKAAGYSVTREDKGGDLILAGDRGDAGYYLILGPSAHGATPVDYIWAQGG